jgi:Ser/Thr protein kinase RdoA (MazF antagonist)
MDALSVYLPEKKSPLLSMNLRQLTDLCAARCLHVVVTLQNAEHVPADKDEIAATLPPRRAVTDMPFIESSHISRARAWFLCRPFLADELDDFWN